MNPLQLLEFQTAWNKFKSRHPKFPKFLKAVSQHAVAEGTILEITVTDPQGKTYTSNLKLTEEDLELIRKASSSGK